MRRLKLAQVKPVRDALVKRQKVCPLCQHPFTGRNAKKPALDHDHRTGYIRDAICLNCNGMEGKIFNRATRAKGKLTEYEWLSNLLLYYERHQTPQHGGYLHPTHKTEAEKRLAINAKARKKRAAAKAAKG